MSAEPQPGPQTLDEVLHEYHQGRDEFMRGSNEKVKRLFSTSDDVTLANPFGPVAKGWDRVVEAMDRAVKNYATAKLRGSRTSRQSSRLRCPTSLRLSD